MKVIKCKHVGDKADPYCIDCDGITILEDGQEIPANKCVGYIADEQPQEEPEGQVPFEESKQVEEKPLPKKLTPKKPVKKSSDAPKTEESQNVDEVVAEAPKPSKKPIKNSNNEESDATVEVKNGEVDEISIEKLKDIGVNVKSMRCLSSRTVKVGEDYFKFSAEEEWDVENADPKVTKKLAQMMYSKLNAEVDAQLVEAIGPENIVND